MTAVRHVETLLTEHTNEESQSNSTTGLILNSLIITNNEGTNARTCVTKTTLMINEGDRKRNVHPCLCLPTMVFSKIIFVSITIKNKIKIRLINFQCNRLTFVTFAQVVRKIMHFVYQLQGPCYNVITAYTHQVPE